MGDIERLAAGCEEIGEKGLASILRTILETRDGRDVDIARNGRIRIPDDARRILEQRSGEVAYIDLHAETLDQLREETGIGLPQTGVLFSRTVGGPAMRGVQVAMYANRVISDGTFNKSFQEQLAILAKENGPIDQLVFVPPQTFADVIVIARYIYKKYGTNMLEKFTRVGQSGAFLLGEWKPDKKRITICPDYAEGCARPDIGLLNFAIPVRVIGRTIYGE
jgi:hypothetical protein